ncbi:MAG TPA: methyltransferase domain-containing protein [Bacteroidota bacterium]
MTFLVPPRRFNPETPELMDVPNPDPRILSQDHGNLRIINKYFGGLRAVRQHVGGLLSKMEDHKPVRILDLATGSADQPISLVTMARKLGRPIEITAIERSPLTLSIARDRTKQFPEIRLEQGDVRSIHYSPGSFDIALCSLAIHHFSREDAVRILRTMNEVSRVGFVVNDLDRSWPAAWTAWIYTHLTTRNPMTLNDSYVSVLRAFTPEELQGMARDSGVRDSHIFRHPMFRLVLVAEH